MDFVPPFLSISVLWFAAFSVKHPRSSPALGGPKSDSSIRWSEAPFDSLQYAFIIRLVVKASQSACKPRPLHHARVAAKPEGPSYSLAGAETLWQQNAWQ